MNLLEKLLLIFGGKMVLNAIVEPIKEKKIIEKWDKDRKHYDEEMVKLGDEMEAFEKTLPPSTAEEEKEDAQLQRVMKQMKGLSHEEKKKSFNKWVQKTHGFTIENIH
jgi:Skp family chaperone for outer membrane proteins